MLVTPTINSVHGRILSITGTDPAVSTDILETAPDRRRWRLCSVHFTLITDENEANRQISIIIDDGTNTLLKLTIQNVQAASLTRNYTLANFSVTEVLVGEDLFHPLPPLCLPAGFRFRTVTDNLQIGDNYSAPQALIEEWIDPTS
ncbi:hypothetical protein ES708_32625 [subsurface metagenome]